MPTTNPYSQKNNPWLYSKWNQEHGICGNPYTRRNNPKKYSQWERRHGHYHGCVCHVCRPTRRRRYCG